MSEPSPFGAEIRSRRTAAGLSLGELARRVHYSKGHLSKVEAGQKPASAGLVRLCDAELGAGGELVNLLPTTACGNGANEQPDGSDPGDQETWVIGIGNDGAYFTPVSDPHLMANGTSAAVGMTFEGQARANTDAALGPFLARFDEARNLGQVAGPDVVFPLVILEARTLQVLADHAPPYEQTALLQLAARYAEFAGWMAQEAGDDRMAWWLTKKAVRMANAGGDPSLRLYALVRRADIALYQDDALSLIELSRRAQQHDQVPVRIRGLAAQREAQGHALIGDRTACMRAIERSAVLLTEATISPQAGPTLGTARTPDLVALMKGWCLHDLGRPAEAAELLDREIVQFPPRAHRARVRYQTRAALAYAMADELERATELIVSLLEPARILDSATIRHDLRSLTKVLARRRSYPAVRPLLPALTTLLQEKRNTLIGDPLLGH